MFVRRVIGGARHWTECPLTGDAAFELRTNFLGGALLKRIGASAGDERAGESYREGFHLSILGNECFSASCDPHRTNRSQGEGNFMIEPELLLQGYRLGIFPMAMEDNSIEWFSPDPRGIIPLESFHLPHTARRAWERKVFEIKIDNEFREVIRQCAQREDTWINRDIVVSYERLHALGHAHSVEAWQEGELVGGLYGVALGGAFFGESMFHLVNDASKVALAALVERLRARKFTLLDTQWVTPHLVQFGAIEITRAEYLHLLDRAVNLRRTF
jgi:leucyl/phenylalanyl-tRNA--protein transferase